MGGGVEDDAEFAPLGLEPVGLHRAPRVVVRGEGENAGFAGSEGGAVELEGLALEDLTETFGEEGRGLVADVGREHGGVVEIDPDLVGGGGEGDVVGICQYKGGKDAQLEAAVGAVGDALAADTEAALREHGVDAVARGGLGARRDRGAAVQVGVGVELFPGRALLGGRHRGGGHDRVGGGVGQAEGGAVVGQGLREGEGQVALEAAAALIGEDGVRFGGEIVEAGPPGGGGDRGGDEGELVDLQDAPHLGGVDGKAPEIGQLLERETLRGHQSERRGGGGGRAGSAHGGAGGDVGIDEVGAGFHALVADPVGVAADGDVGAGAGAGHVRGGGFQLDQGGDDIIAEGRGGLAADEEGRGRAADGDRGIGGGGEGESRDGARGGVSPGGGGVGHLPKAGGGGGKVGCGVERGVLVAADQPLQAGGAGAGAGLGVARVAPDSGPVAGAVVGGALHAGGGRGALVGPGVGLQLADGDIESGEGVLACGGEALAVGGHLRLDAGEGGEADADQNEKSDEDDGDQQREAPGLTGGMGEAPATSGRAPLSVSERVRTEPRPPTIAPTAA